MPKDDHVANRIYELDEWVSQGNMASTVTAASPQEQIAQDGNVVPKLDGCAAAGTVRYPPNNRFFAGKSINADIEKAADCQPNDSYQGVDPRRNHCLPIMMLEEFFLFTRPFNPDIIIWHSNNRRHGETA
jgi:hypothetical protein